MLDIAYFLRLFAARHCGGTSDKIDKRSRYPGMAKVGTSLSDNFFINVGE
jgi:hypothetical protein